MTAAEIEPDWLAAERAEATAALVDPLDLDNDDLAGVEGTPPYGGVPPTERGPVLDPAAVLDLHRRGVDIDDIAGRLSDLASSPAETAAAVRVILAAEADAEPESGQPVADRAPTSWAPVPLGDLDADISNALPRYLTRTDGKSLLYQGKVHAFIGESESGKSLLVQHAAADEIRAGRNVAYVDFEDSARSVVERLEAFGLTRAQILARLAYLNPSEPIGDRHGRITPALLDLTAALDTLEPSLVILDGVTEAMTLEGLSPLDNADVAKWWAMVPRYIAARGPAVAMVDHVTKDRENRGRFAIGAQHKLAAIDGAAYSVDLTRPFVRGGIGEARIGIAKDRPGHVRPHATGKTIATFLITSTAAGMTAELRPPGNAPGMFRPTTIMERVSRALEANPPGFTKSSLRTAVSGNNGAIDVALDLLIGEGYVTVHSEGQAHRHVTVRPFRAPDEGQDQTR